MSPAVLPPGPQSRLSRRLCPLLWHTQPRLLERSTLRSRAPPPCGRHWRPGDSEAKGRGQLGVCSSETSALDPEDRQTRLEVAEGIQN